MTVANTAQLEVTPITFFGDETPYIPDSLYEGKCNKNKPTHVGTKPTTKNEILPDREKKGDKNPVIAQNILRIF